jgi:hypothetical protein
MANILTAADDGVFFRELAKMRIERTGLLQRANETEPATSLTGETAGSVDVAGRGQRRDLPFEQGQFDAADSGGLACAVDAGNGSPQHCIRGHESVFDTAAQ